MSEQTPTCGARHAVVTGASSGIGRATAVELSRRGFHVFGTVRRAADAEALRREAPGQLTPLLVDVTEAEQVQAAAKAVEQHVGHAGLDVLVNNAGVGAAYPLELIPPETFGRQLDVNVTAQVAVTQSLLPAIRRARGRIVMIGSIGGRITMPFGGSLVASKRAVQALAEAFRLELSPWGIRVVLVEPASIRTDAVDKLERDAHAATAGWGPEATALYGRAFTAMVGRSVRLERGGSPPEVVAAVVARACESARPRVRYLAGRHSRVLATVAKLPPWLLDPLRLRLFGLPRRPGRG